MNDPYFSWLPPWGKARVGLVREAEPYRIMRIVVIFIEMLLVQLPCYRDAFFLTYGEICDTMSVILQNWEVMTMARRNRDEDYDYEYEDEYEDEYEYEDEGEKRGLGSKAVFLLILGVLLLALTVLCVLLTGKLRSANKEVLALRSELETAKSVSWTEPQEVTQPFVPTETVPIPTPGEVVSLPEVTTPPETASTPAPTPSAAPIVTAGALPSWITEADMAKITRRPQDDEWYGAPGKLYVTASLGLNLRSGLRTDINNIVTQIKCGSEVEVYAASGNMRFVQDPKGNFGWCSNNLLSNEPPKGVDIIPFTKAPVQTPTPVSTAPEQSDVPVPEVPTING